MRRYTDLTKKELVGLSKEDTDRLIDIEIAYAGIEPVYAPTEPNLKDVKLLKSHTAFEVFGILFANQEDAITVSQMLTFREDYDYYGSGYDYKYLSRNDDNGVKTRYFYEKNDVAAVKEILQENRLLQEKYNEEEKAYKAFVKSTSEIRNGVLDAITAAHNFFQRVTAMKLQYRKYLNLSEGDEKIAMNFFNSAYGELTEEYAIAVFGDQLSGKPEEANADH